MIEDYKLGLGPTGMPVQLGKRDALRMATSAWCKVFVDGLEEEARAKWKPKQLTLQRALAAKEVQYAKDDAKTQARENRAERHRGDDLRAMRATLTKELREKITIEGFDHAIAQAPNCEHLRTKAWGDAYGKGVRCAKCGIELTSTQEDEEQQRGIGSGDDKRLMKRFDQHRRNETGFRFIVAAEVRRTHVDARTTRTQSHAETRTPTRTTPTFKLAEVEGERVRLEKERRLLQEIDPYFYDLHDMQALYQFDR